MKERTIKTLLITSCTSAKKYDRCINPIDKINAGDIYFNDQQHGFDQKAFSFEFQGFKCEALDMYVGHQYGPTRKNKLGPIKNAIALLHKQNANFDHYILSAGYGFIKADTQIVPYDITFERPADIATQTNNKCRNNSEWASFLQIRKKLDDIIGHYDLIIFLLAGKYTNVLKLNNPILQLKDTQKVLYIDFPNNVPEIESFKILDPSIFRNEQYGNNGRMRDYKIRGNLFYHVIQIAAKKKIDPFLYLYETKIDELTCDLNRYCFQE